MFFFNLNKIAKILTDRKTIQTIYPLWVRRTRENQIYRYLEMVALNTQKDRNKYEESKKLLKTKML